MSSNRTGYGLPARPNDGLRTRRPSEPIQSGGIPRPAIRATKSDADTTLKTTLSASQQNRFSRVPQPTSAPRQAGRPQAARRPSLDHQSSGSTSTASSRAKSHTQSGSSSSSSSRSYDNSSRPGRRVLRRKESLASQDVGAPRDPPYGSGPSSSIPRSRGTFDYQEDKVNRYMTASPDKLILNEAQEPQSLSQSPMIYPELDRYRNLPEPTLPSYAQHVELPFKLATQDLPPPTPASLLSSQLSASPSTKFSGSPGPGPYSRDTTPTSMSSVSPGLTATARFGGPKARQLSPAQTRPPVTRRRAGSFPNEVDVMGADPQGLAAVRESLTSSSSSSTVKDGDRNAKKEKKPTKHLPPPPPSPPPRKSSQKFRKNSDDDKTDNRKASTIPTPRSRSSSATSSPQKQSTLSPRNQPVQSRTKPPTPRRPSRDGTSNIHSQLLSPAPIIHSNLSSTSLPNERRGSESNDLAPARPSHRRERNASTSQLPAEKELASAKGSASKNLGIPEPTRPSRTPSPNVGSSFRFPFFGRKKAAAESPPKSKKEPKESKPARKGPAAGTGHEGYGKLGAIRRRSGSSNLSRGVADKQISQESLVSNDPFFADRMNPVVIAGGSVVENRNTSSELTRTESNQSLPVSRPSTDSRTGADINSSKSGSRTTFWPSPSIPGPSTAASSRRPSESSDSEGSGMKSTLAFRRSVQRLRSSPENPMRLPQPINTAGVASSPMTSFDTSVMSDESHYDLQREVSRGRDPVHPAPKKLVKRERSPRKWNLFGRSQKQTPKKEEKTPVTAPEEKKPVAFYTMMDPSEQELSQELEIQDVLRNADVYHGSPQHSTPDLHSIGWQTPEIPRPATRNSPKKFFHNPDPVAQIEGIKNQTVPPPPEAAQPHTAAQVTAQSGRPSRLQQVGRIPAVISSRQETSSPKSFSRPFRASLQSAPQPAEYLDPESIAKGPSPTGQPDSTPDLTMEGSTAETADSVTNVSSSCDSQARAYEEEEQQHKEFLRFSPRKNSEGTVETSSSSGMFPLATNGTAVIPRPDDPPVEDEIWNEYDDLLEDDKPPPSATSSKGIPFHLETYHSRLSKEKAMESPTLAPDKAASRVASAHSLAPTASSCYSQDMTERIRNAFQPHPSPKSPPMDQDARTPEVQRDEPLWTAPTPRPQRSLSPIKERNSDTSCSSSENESPLSQVNLRVGSMTVSKWLTFGHVLFSDVRHDLISDETDQSRDLKSQSVLVIDGLGNDDWSFYAAETYPSATFYNLSPRAPLPTELQTSPNFPLTPSNHHQIQYVSHLQKFPFAAQSFTSVVYRFPIAAPESHYRNILSEARRVLKPGGYLEMSILDVDLNNMGTRGRRAARQLKERIHAVNSETSLASTADLIVKLIGSAGFYDVKAARVGVPVASPITRSHHSIKVQDRKAASKKNQPSLSEMMSDNSAKADENITKMVARVGRWWYTRCYESADDPTSPAPTSIWNDKALIRECEEFGTSLKLMVCCGRAPERVLSV